MDEITRRRFLQYGAGAGAGLILWRFGAAGQVLAMPIPGGTLPPSSIPKYESPLVIPPAMPPTGQLNQGGESIDYYKIGVRQFQQHILPESMELPTTVWSYGSLTFPATFNYPTFTIEAEWRTAVRVNWVNQLVDGSGNYLPHLLPIDQTLHWANPPGGPGGRHGDARSDALRGVGADRHASARRALGSGERRLPRGLVPAPRKRHPGRVRHRRLALRHVQGGGRGPVRPEVGAGQGRVPIRQRPAGRDHVVPRPHARDDPLERSTPDLPASTCCAAVPATT